eukprot:766192-Hanusia_phi.AAC.1
MSRCQQTRTFPVKRSKASKPSACLPPHVSRCRRRPRSPGQLSNHAEAGFCWRKDRRHGGTTGSGTAPGSERSAPGNARAVGDFAVCIQQPLIARQTLDQAASEGVVSVER